MQVENALKPDGDRIKPFASKPTEGPIVMVDLLKFREIELHRIAGLEGQLNITPLHADATS